MREYYFLTGLDQSPYQLTLMDALHLGATEQLGAYVLATHDITLKNPDTGADEPGKGFYLKLCTSTLQQMEKDTAKAEHQPPPGYVSEKPRPTQCYSAPQTLISHKNSETQTNESAEPLESDRLVLSHYPNGDPLIICMSDLLFWADDLEQLVSLGVIQRRIRDDTSVAASDQLDDLPKDFRLMYKALEAGELPHIDLLITAWRKYWKGRSPDDGKPYPKNSEVTEWVMDQIERPSHITAKHIAKMIRPNWAPNHRQATLKQ